MKISQPYWTFYHIIMHVVSYDSNWTADWLKCLVNYLIIIMLCEFSRETHHRANGFKACLIIWEDDKSVDEPTKYTHFVKTKRFVSFQQFKTSAFLFGLRSQETSSSRAHLSIKFPSHLFVNPQQFLRFNENSRLPQLGVFWFN